MVQKGEKETEVRLARGPILTTELARLVGIAWADAKRWSAFVNCHWIDGHTATVRNLADLDHIEDAPGVKIVHGRFTYEDGSNLEFTVARYEPPSVSATGVTARQRQTAMAQLWASFPQRSFLHPWAANALWYSRHSLTGAAVAGLLYSLIFRMHDTAIWGWMFILGLLLVGVALWLSVRASPNGRFRLHPIVYHRTGSKTEQIGVWGGLLIGLVSLIVSTLAWLLPIG